MYHNLLHDLKIFQLLHRIDEELACRKQSGLMNHYGPHAASRNKLDNGGKNLRMNNLINRNLLFYRCVGICFHYPLLLYPVFDRA